VGGGSVPDVVCAGQGFGDDGDIRTAATLGVTPKAIDRLCEKVLDSLARGPKHQEEIREAAGTAARSLGEAGKKKGLASTFPLALSRLQSAGEIRRTPTNGRLDQQRYRYALWRLNPLAKFKMSQDEVWEELARRYFRWIGPASLGEFQWFSGLGVKAAKAAAAPLGLASAPDAGDRLMFPEDYETLCAFKAPKKPRIALVSSLDGLVLLRRDLETLIATEDRGTKVFAEKALAPVGGLTDLPSHGIFDRGRLVGLWEYDPDDASIAWMSFGSKLGDIGQAVHTTETCVKNDLGDARSFSLDSPKSHAPRIAALRKAGGG
jgi:hypothetical protein